MAQDLTINIKTTSDVPQAMDKAKAATSGFDKQLEGIGKKFSGAFKDIFLSFLGPMALIGIVMGFIGKLIADNQRKQEEANKAAIDNTNELMSAEDRYWANKRNNEKKDKETVAEAETERKNVTEQFLRFDPRGKGIIKANRLNPFDPHAGVVDMPSFLSDNKAVQDQIQALIAEDAKKNPLPGAGKDFTAPTGFSNVIGVGANPAIEAMSALLEEQRLQTALLQQIVDKGQPPSADFTKEPTSRYPGRGYIPE